MDYQSLGPPDKLLERQSSRAGVPFWANDRSRAMSAASTSDKPSLLGKSADRRATASPRLEADLRQKHAVHTSVKEIIRQYRHSHGREERRRLGRVEFIQSVSIGLENGRKLTVLTRDLSCDGIRLVGTSSLLGQRVQVELPQIDSTRPLCLLMRVLWTCAVGDGLFENGGNFLGIVKDEEQSEGTAAGQ